MKHAVIGTLAHVDAGKTTLTESMLYVSGSIRKLGRVDHQDAFLDYYDLEKDRGITIFLKQALMKWKDMEITLMDTPGHVDFSTEMERTLQVLDYAILVINGMDGVQAHTEMIWKLLKHYHLPVFLFVNKMDVGYLEEATLMEDIKQRLDERCVDFSKDLGAIHEAVALCDDELLETYMTKGLDDAMISDALLKRKLFPCFFGSALKMQGIEALLNGILTYTSDKRYPTEFGAKVFKVSRDEQGDQLTHMKITGGVLKVKTKLTDEDKVDQIRLYSGTKYQLLQEIPAGRICAVKGLHSCYPGDTLGMEENTQQPVLSSYMKYRILPPTGYDHHTLWNQVKQFAMEDPQLHVAFDAATKEISVELMGEIQIEVLKKQINDRFQVDVEFDKGSVVYKETIKDPVEGVGHFEPLRHYAEVHLLIEPAPRGSGLHFSTKCSEDHLPRHWQRLILTHLEEMQHPGVLTGSQITDMNIILLAGKAHAKHTEGGDFRQATYRAVRQGLKSAESILLEPYYQFQLEVPNEVMSKAIYDIESMHGTFEISNLNDHNSLLSGKAPVALMQNYQQSVMSYTKGKGRFRCELKDYEPCINQEEVIQQIGYDSEADVDHPTGSVFCTHGSGFYVPWNEVKNYMHIKNVLTQKEDKRRDMSETQYYNEDEELEAIFKRTYGEVKKRTFQTVKKNNEGGQDITFVKKPSCILVDGYNVIHDWPELRELALQNLDAARTKLINAMCNYQGYKNCLLILVFDAYQVVDGIGSMNAYHNIFIVYTRKAQTADMYIERATHHIAKEYQVTVVTSDAMEQLIVIGQGAHRMSARELRLDLENIGKREWKDYMQGQKKHRTYLLEEIRAFSDGNHGEE